MGMIGLAERPDLKRMATRQVPSLQCRKGSWPPDQEFRAPLLGGLGIMRLRLIVSNLATAAATLLFAFLLFNIRTVPLASAPATPRLVEASPPVPVVEPPGTANEAPLGLDANAWRIAEADEQVNIRVYEAVNRSVVNITTSATVRGFFEDATTTGSGSGFVLDKQGTILTNFHVIEGAEALQVGFYDGSVLDAEVIGLDPSNDVALLRVSAPEEILWPIVFGDSTTLKVGQKVLALGNPFGLERTLTTGIISSLDRSIESINGRMIKGIIQTDAAINPGNSGGPLLNTRGQVIGMNTAIFSKVGQSAGIGFAVPIANIERILKPLLEEGRVVRSDLGVRRVLALEEGLLIVDVEEGSPAQRAGLRPVEIRYVRNGPFVRPRIDPSRADIIVAVEGVRVRTVSELLTEVESHSPGKRIRITILRDGNRLDVPVTLARGS